MKNLLLLTLLLSLNSYYSFADVPKATKAEEKAIALEFYQRCLDEIDMQYEDEIKSGEIQPHEIEEFNKECHNNYKADLELIKREVK